MRQLISGMRAELYSEGASSGFIVSEQSNIHITARYVQKVQATEKVTDPLGNTLEFPVVHFSEQKFELFARPSHLLLVNSTTLAKALVGRLAEFSDFTISVEPLEFSPEKVLTAFSQRFEQVSVYAASIEGLSLSAETTVRLNFESSGKLEQEARQFLKPRRFHFTAIKFSFQFAGQLRRCECKGSGAVCIFGDEDPDLLKNVLEILQPFIAAQSK